VVTATWSVPIVVILAAGITDVIPFVPMNIDVGSGTPFHCTAEQGERLLPFTVSGTGDPVAASTAAFVGEIELRAGVGRFVPVANGAMENGREFEFVPGVPADTLIATVPRKAVSAAVIVAVSCVGLTKVVGRGEPFQLTTSPFAKPVPVTVSVSPVWLQNGVLFDDVVDAESAVTVGRTIEKETELDVLALNAGEATAICAVPTAAISVAGSVAVSWAGFV
jgi:hypothetical protein